MAVWTLYFVILLREMLQRERMVGLRSTFPQGAVSNCAVSGQVHGNGRHKVKTVKKKKLAPLHIFSSSESQKQLVGATGFSRAKVYNKNGRAPGHLLLPKEFQKRLKSRSLIGQKMFLVIDFPLLCSNYNRRCLILPAECLLQDSLIRLEILPGEFIQPQPLAT